MNTIVYWRGLQQNFIDFLLKKGYERTTIEHYRATMGLLVRYTNAHEYAKYTPQIGQEFLRSEERLNYLQAKALRSQRKVIRRLDEFLDIDNGRGESDEPYIFLTNRKTPLGRSLPTAIAAKYFKESGIDLGDRRHGSHALRSTFASELVEEGVPFEAVRKILGHEDPKALTYYVKFATESLRFCALEVPAPSGRFAAYLSGGKGGARNG